MRHSVVKNFPEMVHAQVSLRLNRDFKLSALSVLPRRDLRLNGTWPV